MMDETSSWWVGSNELRQENESIKLTAYNQRNTQWHCRPPLLILRIILTAHQAAINEFEVIMSAAACQLSSDQHGAGQDKSRHRMAYIDALQMAIENGTGRESIRKDVLFLFAKECEIQLIRSAPSSQLVKLHAPSRFIRICLTISLGRA
jgi:hypothetical protein